MKKELIAQATALFRDTFGTEPEIFSHAPGRVNLIGEHTDYHEGYVFPAAIDRSVVVAARRSEGRSTYVSSSLGATAPFSISNGDFPRERWAIYGAGVGALLGPGVPEIQAALVSDLPSGAGVSSSAALEMAFGVLYRHLACDPRNDIALARVGQACENKLLAVPCGLMDQLASIGGKEDHALLIDIRHPEAMVGYPLDPEWRIVICDTQEKHDLGFSGYPVRRKQSFSAAHKLGQFFLRDVSLAELDAGAKTLTEVEYRRARHIITDSTRCLGLAEAFSNSDKAAIFRLMNESHTSMKDDYEISTRRLDAMQGAATGAPGCIGARMTGGGFGGSVVAIVENAQLEDFLTVCKQRFSVDYPGIGDWIVTRAVAGAGVGQE